MESTAFPSMPGFGLSHRPRVDSVQEQASIAHHSGIAPSPQGQQHPQQQQKQQQQQHHDWTEDLVQTDYVRFFRKYDWVSTVLGPLETWCPMLQYYTRMVMADSRAACIWWGADPVAVYNEKYKVIAGIAHPQLLGRSLRECLPEIWALRKRYFEETRKTGLGVDYNRDEPMFVQHEGWREEAFFVGNLVPVGDGLATEPKGFYNSLVEDTSWRLAQRRTSLLNRLASLPDVTLANVWPFILATLETNNVDIPMALLYETEGIIGTPYLRLHGQIGVPDGHDLLVDGAPLTSDRGVIPECRRAGNKVLTIETDDRFAAIKWRGYGEGSHHIGIIPLASGSRIFGYLVVGTNPCRRFGSECLQFLHDLQRTVSHIISIAVHSSDAALRQRQLEVDLEDSDKKLRHLIEHAAVGMCNVATNGKIIWANEQFYILHGMDPKKNNKEFAFFDVYSDEDKARSEAAWDQIISGNVDHVTMELQLKQFYTSPLGEKEHTYIQILAFPYHEHGDVKSIMAAATDISRFKWAQNFQARLAAEAREAKRQQEAFIDVVSHEMRNPLSAIVHCADEISRSAQEHKAVHRSIPAPCAKFLEDNASSANIILQCSNHQKRIIDDVLTLSRLDSMLLSFNPSPTRPLKLINTIIGIFEAELKSNQIAYNVVADPSLTELDIGHVYLDPSRVTQIFINLITNAIKFTKSCENPTLTIHYGATLSNPRDSFPKDMYWATRKETVVDMTENPEWGDGEAVYLTFTLQDTGIGMTDKDIRQIFDRFRQANMRTHVKYGGSGLGLFISKQLAEKQGGEIGVVSEPGKGSTFGFYIKTKRVPDRPKSLGILPNIPQHVLDSAISTTPRAGAGAGDGNTESEKAQLRVLLVEDNLINQQVLVRQLRKAGCIVDVANHGSEALDILDTGKTFDVVLMDLEMPVMDGLTAMQEIRAREENGKLPPGRLPMIAVTANVRPEQIESAKEAGADHVMQKPFKAIDLVRMMKELVPQVGTPSSEPTTPGLIGPLSGMLL